MRKKNDLLRSQIWTFHKILTVMTWRRNCEQIWWLVSVLVKTICAECTVLNHAITGPDCTLMVVIYSHIICLTRPSSNICILNLVQVTCYKHFTRHIPTFNNISIEPTSQRTKIPMIFQRTFSVSHKKYLHCDLNVKRRVLKFQLTKQIRHCCRYWLGWEQRTSGYLNQCWQSSLSHVTRLQYGKYFASHNETNVDQFCVNIWHHQATMC